jgi:hypothetical protein
MTKAAASFPFSVATNPATLDFPFTGKPASHTASYDVASLITQLPNPYQTLCEGRPREALNRTPQDAAVFERAV